MQEASLTKSVPGRAASSIGASTQIILLSIGGAVLYGILHDQVTARICVEYFTIGHHDYWGLQDPTLLAFEWGVVATWWVGLSLGLVLAICARGGRRRPPLTARHLLRPTLVLLTCTGIIALAAGVIGSVLARSGGVFLVKPLALLVPPTKQVAFLTDLWAHDASYLVGFLGGIVVCIWSWHQRGKLQVMLPDADTSSGARRGEKIVLSTLMLIGGLGFVAGILFQIAVTIGWII